MLVRLLRDEHPAIAQQFDDVGIGLEDIFTDQFRQTDFFGVATEIVDRREDGEADWKNACLSLTLVRGLADRCWSLRNTKSSVNEWFDSEVEFTIRVPCCRGSTGGAARTANAGAKVAWPTDSLSSSERLVPPTARSGRPFRGAGNVY